MIRRREVRIIGGCLGVALFAAAIAVAVSRGQPAFMAARETIATHPSLGAALVALPLGSWAVTSGIFWILLAPRDAGRLREHRVPLWEMACLIGAAGLLNYLPLKPGLVGRIAYHRVRHGIPTAQCVASVLQAIVIGIGCTALLLLAAVTGRTWMLAVMPGVPAIALAWLLMPSQRANGRWRFAAAALLRGIDLLLWMGRAYLAFRLVGQPLTLTQAAAVTAVSQAALLIPIAGNGLGVREWVTALVASSLPAAGGATATTQAMGLSADLINRAAELTITVPLGVVCVVVLHRLRGRTPGLQTSLETASVGNSEAENG